MAAVELNDEGHPQHVRFDPIADLKGSTMASWARTPLHEAVHLVTDGWASFSAAGAVVAEHGAIIVSPRQSSDLEVFQWVNTFIANLKTAIRGTYHHFDFEKYAAHLQIPRRIEHILKHCTSQSLVLMFCCHADDQQFGLTRQRAQHRIAAYPAIHVVHTTNISVRQRIREIAPRPGIGLHLGFDARDFLQVAQCHGAQHNGLSLQPFAGF